MLGTNEISMSRQSITAKKGSKALDIFSMETLET